MKCRAKVCGVLMGMMPMICPAWSGFDVTEGPLQLVVDEVPPVADPATPTPVQVHLRNLGNTPISGRVELREFVDAWHAVGPASRSFRLAAHKRVDVPFRIASGNPVYAALYPVHAFAEFATNFSDGARCDEEERAAAWPERGIEPGCGVRIPYRNGGVPEEVIHETPSRANGERGVVGQAFFHDFPVLPHVIAIGAFVVQGEEVIGVSVFSESDDHFRVR